MTKEEEKETIYGVLLGILLTVIFAFGLIFPRHGDWVSRHEANDAFRDIQLLVKKLRQSVWELQIGGEMLEDRVELLEGGSDLDSFRGDCAVRCEVLKCEAEEDNK